MFVGRPRRGYSFLEVLVAVAILVVGIIGILQILPRALSTAREANLRGKAAMLAQAKVEEIRRDDSVSNAFIESIRDLDDPTEIIPFPEDDRLAYQFHSRSVKVPDETPGDPFDDHDVPRIIVRYNPGFRPSADVLFELRFEP